MSKMEPKNLRYRCNLSARERKIFNLLLRESVIEKNGDNVILYKDCLKDYMLEPFQVRGILAKIYGKEKIKII